MVVVSNSSPLIAFADIGQLNLLPAIFGTILIPPAVAAEIAPTIAELPVWLHVEALKRTIPGILIQPSLGAGERQALALAIEAGAGRILLDDLPARRVARSLDLTVTGTIGVLLAAKRRSLIVSVRPHLDALVRGSFFVGSGLYEEVLQLGEHSERRRT